MATATFQQGVSSYTGTSDCTIRSSSTNEHITAGCRIRPDVGDVYLLHFDISSISTSATVSSATVQLYLSEQNCVDETVEVRAIENPDNSGAFDDNEAADDVFNDYATWAYKDHGATTDWDSGASNDFADVDDNTAADSQSSGACPGYVAVTFTITSMVQGWVTTPTSNGGMFFKLSATGAGHNVLVYDKRGATSSQRPLLTVNYTDGGAAAATGYMTTNTGFWGA